MLMLHFTTQFEIQKYVSYIVLLSHVTISVYPTLYASNCFKKAYFADKVFNRLTTNDVVLETRNLTEKYFSTQE